MQQNSKATGNGDDRIMKMDDSVKLTKKDMRKVQEWRENAVEMGC